ncbi:MAG: acetylglutamate kinase [Dehalococcoidia bacterium]|nr:acetylglutamate kinase [Dehalococcoidia bacterium]MDD5648021.1 acetylglutamate kinase [Dehalococcoidia bacterium]
MFRSKIIVVKIGGSTLGQNDTTLEDLVTLQKKRVPVVVVHGGGNAVTDWLGKLHISTRFVQGLRVTDEDTLMVVTAVLAGLINKELVSEITRRGGKAVGISGADGAIVVGKNRSRELGLTAEELTVNSRLLKVLLNNGYMPVIAPVCINALAGDRDDNNLLNVNGDTIAAEIAAALDAGKLIFLTDVPGIYDDSRQVITHIDVGKARNMIENGTASGGMVAKLEAGVIAARKVSLTRIIDGRVEHALIDEIEGKGKGTTIVNHK